MNEYSYVYILVEKSKKKFKIGLTKDILQRYRTLNSIYGEFSVKDSYLIKCKGNYAKKLEKILHFTFNNFNLYINSDSEGHTEWFDVSCLNNLVKFVKEIKQINKNIIEIKQNIQEIGMLNESSLNKNKIKKQKKEYRMKQIKRENILNTITFLKTIKKLMINFDLYKKDNYTIVFKNITSAKAEEFANELFLSLFYETIKSSGGFNIVGYIFFSENKLYIRFDLDYLSEYKNLEQIKKSYSLLKCFFEKYFNIEIK